MDVIIEDFELSDAQGFFYAIIPTLLVEIDVQDSRDWSIVSAEIVGCLRGQTKTIRRFSRLENSAEFSEIKRDLMATHKDYLQGCVHEHLADIESSRADTAADKRRDQFLHEMRPAVV